jgi:hypothetical protein
LLGKQWDYWKPKGRFSLAWAFFATTTSSSPKVSSSENETNQHEQLKCVFCYIVAPIAVIKKGIFNYKTTNEIFEFQKHIETFHRHVWSEWQKRKKDGPKGPRQPLKKKSNLTLTTIFSFFGSVMPYSKNDPR